LADYIETILKITKGGKKKIKTVLFFALLFLKVDFFKSRIYMDTFGFILTRHVNSELTNKYWNHSAKLLRTFYPNKQIIIIDDNSKQQFIKADFDYENIKIIQSEFPGSGELLPYYYFIKNKFFENAIIIHDSVFIHKRINFEILNNIKVLPLWHFNPDKENINNTLRITNNLKNPYNIYQKIGLIDTILGMPDAKWYGCFGSQAYINHNFLLQLENKYNITNLVNIVKNRPDRCCLERIIGCIFFTENASICKKKSLFGDIMKYQKWGEYTFEKYFNNFNKGKINKNVLKVWTGR
jgi:hypothetical protein